MLDESSDDFFWWCLEIDIPIELEDSFHWKLDQMGITRYALRFAPEDFRLRNLVIWLPSFEWQRIDRDRFETCFEPIAKTFGLRLEKPRWRKELDEDWSKSWKNFWEPDPVGERLLILPAWLEAPEKFLGRIPLRLDPGSAFGTGSHPTTRLCLEAIERHPPKALKVADIGCGSGILSLAALAFGAVEVLSVDIDPLAIRSTLENSRINGISTDRLRTFHGSTDVLISTLKGTSVDLVLCNILFSVIEHLLPSFDKILCLHGRALLSGLLLEQSTKVVAMLEVSGWRVCNIHEKDQWALIEASKK